MLFSKLNSLLIASIASLATCFPVVAQEETPFRSEAFRELVAEQEELREHLAEIDEERARVQEELKEVGQLLALQNELERIERQLDQTEDDERLSESLLAKLAKIETQIELKHEGRRLRRLRRQVAEVTEFLQEMAPNETEMLLPKMLEIPGKATRLSNLLEQSARASQPPDLEEQIEQLYEWLYETEGFVELTEEYLWAVEEEELEEAEELRRELSTYLDLESEHQQAKETDNPRAPNPHAPEQLPVAVNEESLAPYRNVDFRSSIVPLLKTYCFDCHSNDTSYGELNLEAMISKSPIVVDRDKWINVIEQTKNRVMPPEDGTQPGESERQSLVLGLHNLIHEFDYSSIKNPGFETARRLTHQEYDNTVSELFGVEIAVANRFPKELSGKSGFDNSGNTLFVQPLLLERYATAADEIVEELLPREPGNQRQVQASQSLFFVAPSDPSDAPRAARQILVRFVSRAYRRPLEQHEIQRLMQSYKKHIGNGNEHSDAIRDIVRQTLISPNFLMKFETSRESTEFRITDFELASRLSYFLWASMPDAELFRLADSGSLHEPEVLAGQVNRMLQDKRALSLGHIFAAQWLGSQHVGTRVRLDPIDNPWCTDTLMKAMRDETALFFHSLVTNNEPIETLVNADYTFLNNELASLYRIRGIRGQEMRRVRLDASQRGGILGQGSILAVTSFPYRTSPVVRGKWVLDTLLGTPPPPPPPNASELSEDIAENGRLSIRQKLERHRQSPSCNACHSEMDPLGLSLEKFDWFGRYRERYERGRIDDSGSLPTGETFAGLNGLKQVILNKRSEDLVRQVSQKMLSYALGRQLEYYDEPAVRKIISEIAQQENRFQPLIHGIVSSYPFQFKRIPTPETSN